MRWAALPMLAVTTLWFVAVVVAAIDALPGLVAAGAEAPDDPRAVIAYACAAALLGGCCVVLAGLLVRSPRPGRPPPRWGRPLAFGCAALLALAAVLGAGRPELILMGLPAISFALAGLALPRRTPGTG